MVLITCVLMLLLEWIWPPTAEALGERGLLDLASMGGVAKLLYHALAIQVGGEDYEWLTSPGRLLRIGLLFFSLVLSNTYVANLAAFFSRRLRLRLVADAQ